MFIKAWCLKCPWKGIAEVGGSLRLKDYECPKCGYKVKKPPEGLRNLSDEMAKRSYCRLED